MWLRPWKYLANNRRPFFIGQTVKDGGSPIFPSLKKVPMSKRIEMPVFENTQMGMSLGMALTGMIPVSIFPRIDFLICGLDQLVNHIDKCAEMSQGEWTPGIIIRTQIGNKGPLYPGPQHCQDHTAGLKKLCKYIKVVKIKTDKEVIPAYKDALKRAKQGKSTLLIEVPTGAFK